MDNPDDDNEIGPLAALGLNEDFFAPDDPPAPLFPPDDPPAPLFPPDDQDVGPLLALEFNDDVFAAIEEEVDQDFINNMLNDDDAEPIVEAELPIAPAPPVHGEVNVFYEDDENDDEDDVVPEGPPLDEELHGAVINPGEEAEAAVAVHPIHPPPANDPEFGEIEFEQPPPGDDDDAIFGDLQPIVNNYFLFD